MESIMIPFWVVSFLVAGAGVGFVSAMFGVGGCFIMVPVMIFMFTGFGAPLDVAVKVAFGTNLAVVVPTAIVGVKMHMKAGKTKKFPFNLWKGLGLGAGVGSIVGATITSYAPGWIMKILFGVVCLIGAWRFLTAKPKPVEEIPKLSMVKGFSWGFIAATFAAFIGIGGGLVYVPLLNLLLGFPMHLSILLSLAMMVVSSSIGSVSYTFWGLQTQNLGNTIFPPYSIGYFNYGAFLTLGVTSAVFSILGAIVSEKTKPKILRIALGLLYVYIGLKMLGLPI
ncbi:sulfite exporter TauE/SafE family protein [Candidatus Bathyarchaeota archaeon]|nr:MAG: sulfite exporter TauE/SafE family protein [Candidatus Bathyarchaeota archaeon]